MEFTKDILRYLSTQLQIGEDSPKYVIRVWRIGELTQPPAELKEQEGGVTSIEITGSEETGCATANVTFENTYGLKTPEFDIGKISDEYTAGITRSTFERLLWPENKIQICLGYGDLVIPVLTGCIDSFEIDSKSSTISLEIRDNMRFLVDQTIDPIKFGKELSYPREATNVKITPAQTIIEVTGVSSTLNIRSGPGTNYGVIGTATNGNIFTYLGTQGEWHNILFDGTSAYAHTNYCVLKDTPAVVDATGQIDIETNQWLASSIVQDISVIATTIDLDGDNPLLNRSVCNIITDKSVINDPETENFTIKSIRFPFSISYFEAVMEVINQLGNVSFRCNRYGDIMLYKNLRPSLTDFPDWVISDYVDLTSLNYSLDITDLRNKVLIISKNGMALFEHKNITRNYMKGVSRIFAIEVPWAETPEQKHAAAVSFFNQMLDSFRKVTIAIKGNPLIEVGHVVKLNDLVSTATALYQVRSWSHSFNSSGFITTLELEHITKVLPEHVTMITDSIPSYKKKFRYTLPMKSVTRPIRIKLPNVIYKAMLRIKDPATEGILAQIDISEKTYQRIYENTSTVQFVYLLKNDVSVRTTSELINTNIKRQEESGFKAEYVSTVGNFYKCKEADGSIIYLWKDYCTIVTSTGGSSISTGGTGSAGTFVSLVSQKVGLPYVWGTQGEVITQSFINQLISTFGASHYPHIQSTVGQQAFDCSGLVVWALRYMGLIPKTADYTADGLYSQLCYPIEKSQLVPGDLVFRSQNGSINHVGIYVGENQIVHAKGKNYGVVTETMPSSINVFGRLKSIDTATYETYDIPAIDINRVPLEYVISSTYNVDNAPETAKTKASELGGNLLCYSNNCILYSVSVLSEGGTNNVLSINWTPLGNDPVIIELDYDLAIY